MDLHHKHLLFNRFFIILALFLAVNAIIVDAWILNNKAFIQKNIEREVTKPSTPIYVPQTALCPVSCQEQISEATASFKLTTSQTPTKQLSQNTDSVVKEYFIPLGSGVSTAEEWTDVPGAQAQVDSKSYGAIKKATFEVAVHIPTGNEYAYVRLYNATDNQVISFSEVYYPGGSNQLFLNSQQLNLPTGNKLYKVQMKTQLKYPAYLDQARIHITLQ